MNAYSIALFVHVTGAVGYFVSLGLEWTGLGRIRSAPSAQQAREWLTLLATVRKVAFASMLTAVITGIYMMRAAWGGVPWLVVTVAAVVLLIALTALAGPRMAALGRAVVGGQEPRAFRGLANHSLLRISLHLRVAVALGIVFLKSAKPDLGGSLAVIGAAVVLGLGSALIARGDVTAPLSAG